MTVLENLVRETFNPFGYTALEDSAATSPFVTRNKEHFRVVEEVVLFGEYASDRPPRLP